MKDMKFPLFVINFKTYESGTGKSAIALAKKLERASKGCEKNVAFAIQNADLYRMSEAVSNPLLAQHGDAVEYGAHTGHALLEGLKENGASGVLINHAEDQKDIKEIEELIKKCRKLQLNSLVCTDKPDVVANVARLGPDIIAIEIPELIGTLIAVSQVKPEVVIAAVENVKRINSRIPVLCGAGIATGNDIKKSIELGCSGILVAAAVMKTKKPESILSEFIASAGIRK